MTEVTHRSLPELVDNLARLDPLFARLREKNGVPPEWRRIGSFATAVLFILEQQVSLASARAAFLRLHEALGDITPSAFLVLNDDELRAIGFSRQKTGYTRGLARLLLDESLDLGSLARLDDERAMDSLIAVRGIGRWTASCWLLFVLGRPDVWPTGDRALYVAMHRAMELDEVPDSVSADRIAEAWSPYRSIAARMLWHDYLGGRSWEPSPALPGVG